MSSASGRKIIGEEYVQRTSEKNYPASIDDGDRNYISAEVECYWSFVRLLFSEIMSHHIMKC